MIQGERECVHAGFWKKVWGLKVPGKVVNFLWRVCRECLPTAVALATRHVKVDVMCSWCQKYREDALHVLFQCSFAQEVWHATGLQSVINLIPGESVMELMIRIFSTTTREECVKIGVLCWSLWQRRNKWVWSRINTSAFGVKASSLNMLADWGKAQETAGRTLYNSPATKHWTKPPSGWIKINVDATSNLQTGIVGLGCVVRDEHGSFYRARSKRMVKRLQPREAEALSLKEALSWIKQWRNYRCIFESDAKNLVGALHLSGGQSYFHTMVEDCKELIKHFQEVLVVFVPRSANTVAHLLATATYSSSDCREWYATPPDFIACNIVNESS